MNLRRRVLAVFVAISTAFVLALSFAGPAFAAVDIGNMTLPDIDGSTTSMYARHGTGYAIVIGGRANCSLTRSAVRNAVSFTKTALGSHCSVAVMDIDSNPSLFRSTFLSSETDRVRFYSYKYSNYNYRMWLTYNQCGGRASSVTLPFMFLVKDKNVIRYATGNTNVSSFAKAGMSLTQPPSSNTSSGPLNLYRMYNIYTGEHLYTTSNKEASNMWSSGWYYEGITCKVPRGSSHPVYRLYNPYSGDHHYTGSLNEYNQLARSGWRGEGVAFHSAESGSVPVYRVFNPYQTGVGAHHYTTSANERNTLVNNGWRNEGTGWYGA